MRTISLLLVLVVSLPAGAAADSQSLRRDFKQRITSAFGQTDNSERTAAITDLFFQDGLDDSTRALLERTVQRLADSDRRQIHFEPLPGDAQFVHALNGYEYRPNLDPVGYVVLTSPEDPPGNDTRIPYGREPDSGRYLFPATVRELVNPDAPADKQLQILAMGVGHPPVRFRGWCDVELSNGKTRRVTLEDNGVGNQTRILRGQKIRACELRRESDHGSLSLRLMQGTEEFFTRRIDKTARIIRYRAD